MPRTSHPPVWLHSDRFVARRLARPIQHFLHIEAAGGIVLLAATVLALVLANSPWSASYHDLWATVASIEIGGHGISEDLHHWVNDGLMALFFFVVGLEIKREVVDGQLADIRSAALPAIAAVGGMVVPALIYAAINLGGGGASGWGIPMATDIAFAVGVLTIVGRRAPVGLKVFLLALAIVDDIGAIVVIALFYSDRIDALWLLAAVGGLLAVVALRRARVRYTPVYVLLGVGVWLATFESGVHATIAGVALGLLTPARPFLTGDDRPAEPLLAGEPSAGQTRAVSFQLRETVSVAERLQDLLHPWTSYVVIPLFALANAGVEISSDALRDAASSPITLGVVLGLVVGKLVGITGAVAIARRFRVGELPAGVTMRHVAGMAAIAGIGFTVSLFVSALAFTGGRVDEAKIGVLAASVLAAALGAALLRTTADHPSD